MNDNKPKSRGASEKHVRRTPPGESREKRRLPPDMEALASGAIKRLPRPRKPAPPLQDPRGHALMPGISNKDVREVYDARVARLRAAWSERDDPTQVQYVAEALCEAVLLGLWRGRSLTSFEAFAEDVLAIPSEQARALAQQGADALELALVPLPDERAALWMRAEAALEEQGLDGRVMWVGDDEEARLSLELAPNHAARALAAIGQRAEGLLRIMANDALYAQPPGASPRGTPQRAGTRLPPRKRP